MAGRSKNRLFSQFIRQLNDDLTVKTQGLTEESRVTTSTLSSQVDSAVASLVSTAPAALDTLDELAAALNDDANFATTVTNSIATKANSADLATVATSGSYNDLSNKPSIPSLSGYATTSYVDTAVAGAGSGDALGTATTVGSDITLDYSTGNTFSFTVNGPNNNVYITNPSADISSLNLEIEGKQAVVGAYSPTGPITTTKITSDISYNINDPGVHTNGNQPAGLDFSPDGLKFYIGLGNGVAQFNLSSPYDLTGINFDTPDAYKNYGSSYLSSRGNFTFNSTGTKLWRILSSSSDSFTFWFLGNVSTPYDLSGSVTGATGGSGAPSNGSNKIAAATVASNGSWFTLDYQGQLKRYRSDGYFNVSSQVYNLSNLFSISANTLVDMKISPDGRTIAIVNGVTVYAVALSSPFDLTSTITQISGAGLGNSSGTNNSNVRGLAFNGDGTEFYTLHVKTTYTDWYIEKHIPTLAITPPSYTFNGTFNSSIPTISHNSISRYNIISNDGGSSYYINESTASSGGSGSGGLVLGEYHAVCNGSALKDVTVQNVTGVQNLTTTYTDATGSVISGISVPSGTKKIIYNYNVMIGWVDTHAISHWKLFYSTDGSTWTEVVDARRNPSAGQNADAHQSLTWPFEIAADTADNDSGKLTTTDTDTYYFKWQVREYSASNEMKLHTTQYWDGGATDQFTVPTVSVKFLS